MGGKVECFNNKADIYFGKWLKPYYAGKECVIHFINNITTQYLKTDVFEQLALIDELTQIPNRRALVNDYEALVQNIDEDKTYRFGIIDLDPFKDINDNYGHDFGDHILKLLAKVFTTRFRNVDKIYRYGGEEFIVLLDNANINDGKNIRGY